jgi:hypothetical protein
LFDRIKRWECIVAAAIHDITVVTILMEITDDDDDDDVGDGDDRSFCRIE